MRLAHRQDVPFVQVELDQLNVSPGNGMLAWDGDNLQESWEFREDRSFGCYFARVVPYPFDK